MLEQARLVRGLPGRFVSRRGWVRELPFLPITVVIAAIGLAIAQPRFLSRANLENVARQGSFLALLGFGQLFPILTGGFDISVGAVVAFSGLIAAKAILNYGVVPGIIIGIAFAAFVGTVSGFLVARFKVSAVVVTLGVAEAARGAALMYSNGQVVYGLPHSFTVIGTGSVGPIPNPLIVVAIAFAACWVILNRTAYGRYVYSIGGNPEAARLAGINVWLHQMLAYTINGVLVGVGTLLVTARVGAAEPTLGQGAELEAIAAVVIGGVALSGGRGRIADALWGVIALSLISNGLNLLGVSSYTQQVVAGAVIVTAVLVDRGRTRSRRRVATREAAT